ncbi:MAG: hypothetical protein KDB80_11150 [Planctomycetes bacterium]|nr:hypothetical protein [Planctomycetota bacterium]
MVDEFVRDADEMGEVEPLVTAVGQQPAAELEIAAGDDAFEGVDSW